MKTRLVFAVILSVASVVLCGCPGTTDLQGNWGWTEPAMPAHPLVEAVYANSTVNENFQNNERMRKSLTLGPITDGRGTFDYVEETFLPDREPFTASDKGAGVVWEWRETYRASGYYSTTPLDLGTEEDGVPFLDTELNAEITSWTETLRILTSATDVQFRHIAEYVPRSDTSDAGNPLRLFAMMGINDFDELLVIWAHLRAKDLLYNANLFADEVYIRK